MTEDFTSKWTHFDFSSDFSFTSFWTLSFPETENAKFFLTKSDHLLLVRKEWDTDYLLPFVTNSTLYSQCPPRFPARPPPTTCPREQLPQSDGLAGVHHDNLRIWNSSLTDAEKESYWQCSFQHWSVEVASGFSPTTWPLQGMLNHNSLTHLFNGSSAPLSSPISSNGSYLISQGGQTFLLSLYDCSSF